MNKEQKPENEQRAIVALLRKAAGMAFGLVSKYFNLKPDKDDEEATIRSISRGASFKGANVWILVFAIFMASLGLNVNSTAVIIGAMLISPLMGPIIGMGLAVGINDFELLKRSAKNYFVATVISVATATIYFLLTPLDEAQSELLARTSPTLYDVLIALFGGAAGIVALSTKDKGNVLPGVAIATALMPPLCTAGFGLATGNIVYFLGAFYLFFINTVFISLATYLGVRMMKFRPKEFVNAAGQRKVKRYIIGVVAATMIPAAFMTAHIVGKSLFAGNMNRFVKEQLESGGTRIVSYDANRDSMVLSVVAVGQELSDSAIRAAEKRMADYKMAHYRLKVYQGAKSDSVMMLSNRLTSVRTASENYADMLNREVAKSTGLQNRLQGYTRYEALASEVAKEMGILFPGVRTVGIANAVVARTDSTTRRRVLAVVGMKPRTRLDAHERERMADWLSTRLATDSLQLVVEE